MKNIIKTVWSCWDKIDRFVAIFSIIMLILIFCTSCTAQPSINNIPDMEYGDAETSNIYDNYIPIYADGVVDFIYCTQDNEYIIEYHDDDYFDLDNLPQTVNCVNGDSVVCIYCSAKYFFEYLEWYNALTYDTITARDNPAFYASNDKFYIKEVYLDEEDTGYWYYKLVKK
jgi:hypothetical protein